MKSTDALREFLDHQGVACDEIEEEGDEYDEHDGEPKAIIDVEASRGGRDRWGDNIVEANLKSST